MIDILIQQLPIKAFIPVKMMRYMKLHSNSYDKNNPFESINNLNVDEIKFKSLRGMVFFRLYKNEKKAFYPFLIATPVLFALGASLVYYFIFPLAWKFFLGFQTTGLETGLAIELEAKVNEYLSLVLKLMFAFGLAFQLPVAVSLLARAGLVTSKGMREKRKYAFVGAFATAAILTPPDLISQVGLGVPIIILYEISIRLASIMERKRKNRDEEDSDDPEDPNDPTNNENSKKNNLDDIEDIPETDFTED